VIRFYYIFVIHYTIRLVAKLSMIDYTQHIRVEYTFRRDELTGEASPTSDAPQQGLRQGRAVTV